MKNPSTSEEHGIAGYAYMVSRRPTDSQDATFQLSRTAQPKFWHVPEKGQHHLVKAASERGKGTTVQTLLTATSPGVMSQEGGAHRSIVVAAAALSSSQVPSRK